MSLITDTYHRISDTLLNFVTGLGTQKDPRSSTRFHYRELHRATLEQMYRSDWLARRIVDLPAEDATREWRQWIAARPQLEKIDLLEKKLELQKKARQALQRARLYGGAALVIGVDQGQPEDELDLDAVGLGDLKFVVVVNRYELAAGPRIFNVDSQWYTRPEYYTVATPMFGFYGEAGGAYPEGLTKPFVTPQWQQGQAPPQLNDPGRQTTPNYGMVRMHPSRVIEFTGNELPDWRLAPMGGGWGDSVLQTVDDSLRDFAMITSGLASLINDMKMDVVRVPDLSRKLSTNDITQKTLERFGLANMAKSSINTLLLDKEEEWERIQTSFGSTPELIKVAMTIACAAGGVPETRIMGNAPNKGLASQGSSGGEVDIRNYYDDIASKQRSQYKPMLHPLDRCIMQSALGRYDPHIDYEWNPLYQPTAQEQANMALAKAQTTQVYVNCGLINEDALREAVVSQLTEDKIYPGLEDAIDEFGAEPEEPPQPLQPAPPTPPPGMMAKGQFDPNPFHMLRAQAAAKAGQPIRVPPNRPAGPQKFLPVPPGAQQKDEWIDDDELEDIWSEESREAALEARRAKAQWTLYHGSPHDFSRFDASHAKSGSGAEVSGHGVYLSESKDYAKKYAQGEHGGRLYTVGVASDPEKFADLDKPLGQQSKFVQEALAGQHLDPKTKLSSAFGSNLRSKAFSDKLAKLGLHGLKASDPIMGKDRKPTITHNYVVFHPEHLSIKGKANVRDADDLEDFNPHHDPKSGEFASAEQAFVASGYAPPPKHLKAFLEAKQRWAKIYKIAREIAVSESGGEVIPMVGKSISKQIGQAVSALGGHLVTLTGDVAIEKMGDASNEKLDAVAGGWGWKIGAAGGALVGGGLPGAIAGGVAGAATGYTLEYFADQLGLNPRVAQHALIVGGHAFLDYHHNHIAPYLHQAAASMAEEVDPAAAFRRVASDAASNEDGAAIRAYFVGLARVEAFVRELESKPTDQLLAESRRFKATLGDFDPDQPRDDAGRWAAGGGGGAAQGRPDHPGHGYSASAHVDAAGTIHTDNVEDAVRALYENRKVELTQPRQVSTMIDRLAVVSKRMIAMGEKAPNFNLCNVSIKGTNLFCAQTKGIPRIEMPQIPQERNQEFEDWLRTDKHVRVDDTTEKAEYLKATQDELIGSKVAAIAHVMETADTPGLRQPIFISRDNYVIDGHHRWAARIGQAALQGDLGSVNMQVHRVDMPVIDVLKAADEFTGGKGHKAATAGAGV